MAKRDDNFAKRATADPLNRCFMPGVPRAMYMGYPFQVFQTPGLIAFTFEWQQLYRMIYTNGSAPPDGLEILKPYPKLQGLSLDMTEPKFLDIVDKQRLKTGKSADGGKVAHHISLGDGHTLMIASKALLSNHIAGRGPSYTEFTPIAHLFSEYMVITVRPESVITSAARLMAPGIVRFSRIRCFFGNHSGCSLNEGMNVADHYVFKCPRSDYINVVSCVDGVIF